MLEFLSDLLFPKRCVGCKKLGSYLCDNCLARIDVYQTFVCPMCLKHSITGETHPSCITPYGLSGLSCGVVYKGVVKKLLFRFKYKPFLSDLASIIGKLFIETISQNELFMRVLYSYPIVVEVPLSGGKLRKRGYNQAQIISKYLATEFKLQFKPNLLSRIKTTNPQFKLNKDARFKNVLNAFELDPRQKTTIRDKTILLVDDLATSCATLRECAKILRRNGAKKVYAATFAREL